MPVLQRWHCSAIIPLDTLIDVQKWKLCAVIVLPHMCSPHVGRGCKLCDENACRRKRQEAQDRIGIGYYSTHMPLRMDFTWYKVLVACESTANILTSLPNTV